MAACFFHLIILILQTKTLEGILMLAQHCRSLMSPEESMSAEGVESPIEQMLKIFEFRSLVILGNSDRPLMKMIESTNDIKVLQRMGGTRRTFSCAHAHALHLLLPLAILPRNAASFFESSTHASNSTFACNCPLI